MQMTKNGWKVVGAAVAVFGVLASVQVASAHGGFGRFSRGGADRGALLADALGITVDELQAAQDKAFDAGLASAVEAGEIEQADADLMLARQKLQRTMDHEAIMAEALGMTTEELAAAREDGKSMRDLMADKGIDAAELRATMQAAHEAAVDKAVADGVITREQADLLGEMHGGMGGMRGAGPGGHGMRGAGPGGHGMRGGCRGHEGFGGPLTPENGGAEIGEPDPAGQGARMAPLGGQDL